MKLGKALNECFDKVYVKNIASAKKRLESFNIVANLIELDYQLVQAIEGSKYISKDYIIKHRPECYPPPHNQYLVGNYCTSLYILLDAMRNNYNSYVICDDDTIFYDIDVESISDNLPSKWDIIILGDMQYKSVLGSITDITFDRVLFREVAGCHCIAFNKSIYWTMLYAYMSFDYHGRFGDVTIGDLSTNPELSVYQVRPDFCYQERTSLKPYTIE